MLLSLLIGLDRALSQETNIAKLTIAAASDIQPTAVSWGPMFPGLSVPPHL